ncbi:anti-sigma factor family protein [Enteractinococcus helveticum]|uniref:Putative zinc-finger domain-containing protein n=1 Tax=Enteractinococcus helveticum TaxID=1837282 RepID=A0A1B7LWJ1_9MICC|nr:zf-HC2 domain-containing protein [Enteractinococcus helveticum]OAV59375.1 hypothetical protein A6F49_16105 [Enteractinococcus helveticum]
MSNQEHERFAQWDAAFVLGALTPADRHDYEHHLEQCSICRDAVGELVPLPGLLARITQPPSQKPEQPAPADLMEGLLLKQAQHRTRRRALLGRIAVAAAVLALVIGIPATLLVRTPDANVSVALAPAANTYTTMSVDIDLEPASWGTRLAIECAYPPNSGYSYQSPWYGLLVTDNTGTTTQVSTWQAVSDDVVNLESATAVDLEDIASLSVVTSTGDTVLTAPVELN